jgi:hypothetical protein
MKRMLGLLGVMLLFGRVAPASESIIWSGEQNIKMGPGASSDWLPSFAWWYLDMNGDGNNDLRFEYIIDFTVLPQNDSSVVVQQVSPSVRDTVPLQAGVAVGETPTDGNIWSTDADTLVDWESVPDFGLIGVGRWAWVTNGYLGVSFTAVDGVHYGWVRISSYDDMRAHIHDWAYESQPGVGISAGMVPEPTTLKLVSVGLSVMAVAWWCRRRCGRYRHGRCGLQS